MGFSITIQRSMSCTSSSHSYTSVISIAQNSWEKNQELCKSEIPHSLNLTRKFLFLLCMCFLGLASWCFWHVFSGVGKLVFPACVFWGWQVCVSGMCFLGLACCFFRHVFSGVGKMLFPACVFWGLQVGVFGTCFLGLASWYSWHMFYGIGKFVFPAHVSGVDKLVFRHTFLRLASMWHFHKFCFFFFILWLP